MAKRCIAKKGNGKPCGAWATKGKTKCSLHLNPERAAQMGAKHGRKVQQLPDPEAPAVPEAEMSADAPKTADKVRDVLAETLVQVRHRKVDSRTANTLAYVATSLLRAIEVADLEKRLDKLDGLGGWEQPDGKSQKQD